MDGALRVVTIEIDQHDALPPAQPEPASDDGDHERGRDERGKYVIGTVSGRTVTVRIDVLARQEPVDGGLEIRLGSRSSFDKRYPRGRVRDEHVDESVSLVRNEVRNLTE